MYNFHRVFYSRFLISPLHVFYQEFVNTSVRIPFDVLEPNSWGLGLNLFLSFVTNITDI